MSRAYADLAPVPGHLLLGRRSAGRGRLLHDRLPDAPAPPGTLLSTTAYVGRWVPPGVVARRILYTTTRGQDRPAVASGLILVPESAVGPHARPADVVLWAHGVAG